MLSASSNTAVPVAPYGRFQQIPFWRLRALFRERGLYDEDVAALTGITVPTLGRRMRGAFPWQADEIAAVCRVVGIPRASVGEFFFPDLPDTNENSPAD